MLCLHRRQMSKILKPIIIKSNKFLDSISWFFKVGGITLYPFIIVRPYAKKSTINHESIHIAQYTELLIIGFLLISVCYCKVLQI